MKKVILIFMAATLMMACQSAQDKMGEAADAAKGAASDAVDATSSAVDEVVDPALESAKAAIESTVAAYQDTKNALGDDAMSLDTETSTLKWVGTKVTGRHEGTINFSEGMMSMSEDGSCNGVFTVDMSTISNTDAGDGAAKLIGHLSSADFFDTANHSTATLVLRNAKSDSGSLKGTGSLTIKGITSDVDVVGTVSKSEGGMTAIVSLDFDRTLFNIRYGSGKFFEDLGDSMINDKVTLKGTLNFTK